MKKSFIAGVSCMLLSGLYVHAQQPDSVTEDKVAPVYSNKLPPPPVPPMPPKEPGAVQAAIPPIPPAPPAPPTAYSGHADGEPVDVTIVNSNGKEMVVRKINGIETVVVKKDGKEQRIKLSTWNKNRKYYEKKYGHLPPPPPPVPPVKTNGDA